MLDRFPGWESRTGIWQVGDIDLVFAAVALGIIDSKIDRVGRAIPTRAMGCTSSFSWPRQKTRKIFLRGGWRDS